MDTCSFVPSHWTQLKLGFNSKRKLLQAMYLDHQNIKACWAIWLRLPRKKVFQHFGMALYQDCIDNFCMVAQELAFVILSSYFFVGGLLTGDVAPFQKILASLTAMFVCKGAIAIEVANPTNLVKVRLQSEGKLPPGVPMRYSGAFNACIIIVRQEGYLALWTRYC
ncbi:hypothetical protein Ancab_007364 [Ancistrocladus abbreviatus]